MKDKNNTIEVWFDGCCEPVNPGGNASYGVYIKNNGQILYEVGKYVGFGKKMSNNVAEYSGLLDALKFLKDKNLHMRKILVRGDSMLVIKQMSSKWRIRKGLYKPYALKAKKLVKKFKKMQFQWISRDDNGLADELSKYILHNKGIVFRLQKE